MFNQFSIKPLLICLGLALTGSSIALADSPQTSPAEKSTESKPNVTGANSEFVFKYLIAEIAGQRGDVGLANNLFYELAKSSRDPRLAERAAKTALYSNNPSLAIPASKLWLELNPESSEAQQANTQIALSTGNLTEAQPLLQKLLEKEDSRANGFLYLNTLLSREKDKQAVLQLIQALAEPYPKLPEAHFTLAHAAWAAENNALALEETNIADSLRNGWEMNAVLKGQILFGQSPDQAIAFYRQFLKKNPKANEVRLTLARMLVNQKRYNEAKPEFEKLTKTASSSPEILVVVGLLSVQAEDYKAAEKSFEQALNTAFKDKDQLYIYLGQVAEKLKQDAKALQWYQKVEQGEHYVEAQVDIASVIARTQGTDAAIKMLDDLQDLSNDQLTLVIQSQANLLGQAQRYQDAYELLGKAVGNLPPNASLSYDFAMAAERVAQTEVSEKELRKLIKMKPDFAQAYNALGYSLADRNTHLDEAKQLIQKALALSPNDHYILDSMGWVEYRLGNLDSAVLHLSQAHTIQNDPEIAAHLGEVLWQQGKHDEATTIWNNALKIAPDNKTLLDTIKKFKP